MGNSTALPPPKRPPQFRLQRGTALLGRARGTEGRTRKFAPLPGPLHRLRGPGPPSRRSDGGIGCEPLDVRRVRPLLSGRSCQVLRSPGAGLVPVVARDRLGFGGVHGGRLVRVRVGALPEAGLEFGRSPGRTERGRPDGFAQVVQHVPDGERIGRAPAAGRCLIARPQLVARAVSAMSSGSPSRGGFCFVAEWQRQGTTRSGEMSRDRRRWARRPMSGPRWRETPGMPTSRRISAIPGFT